jgi:hypothetical protein
MRVSLDDETGQDTCQAVGARDYKQLAPQNPFLTSFIKNHENRKNLSAFGTKSSFQNMGKEN